MKGRTRFQIIVATDSYYLKVESRKDRILTVQDLVAQLKKYTAKIEEAEKAIETEREEKAQAAGGKSSFASG